MKKTFLYILIVALYLLTSVFIMGILGTAVSKKYEVDERYWLIDGDKKLTDQQKKIKTEQLDKEANKLENRTTLFIIGGLASFVAATLLLVKRKTLMIEKKSGT